MDPKPSNPITDPVKFMDLTAQYQTIADEVREAVHTVLDSQAFVLGETVAEFENEIASFCDSRHAVGCASGTDALLLSLMALNVGPGDEVITSPFTFFATGGAIHRVGAIPVFVDIEPDSFNLDPEAVEAAVTDRTRAILPVHIFGQCADMEPLWRIAVRTGIPIIEDAAQALGSKYRGRHAGVLGTTACFSFFPTKNLGGAGDGGMVTTDDPELANRLKSLRVHGQSTTYMHREVGINSRLDAIQAAILSVKLRYLDDWAEGRRVNARRYNELIRQAGLLDRIELPEELPERKHVYNQYTVRVRGGQRDAVQGYLRNRGIGCNVYYPVPLHLQDCFSYLSYQPGDLPEAELACESVLSLPIYPEVTAGEQERVVNTLAQALARGTTSKAA